jgi:hypothetical protein
MKTKRVAKKTRPGAKAKRGKPGRAKGKPTPGKRAPAASVFARTVEMEVPFLEVVLRERVTEESVVRLFEEIRAEVLRHTPRRVFVDMRESSVELSISDMAGLAKMVGMNFAGAIDRLVLLLRPQDMLAEKFFEPSVSSRGVPTLTTTDLGDALHFLTAKLRPVR